MGEAPGARRFLVVILLQSPSLVESNVGEVTRRSPPLGVASFGAVRRKVLSASRRTPALLYALHSQTSLSHAGTHAASVPSPDEYFTNSGRSGERLSKWRTPSSQIVKVVRKPFVQGWTRRAEVRDDAESGGGVFEMGTTGRRREEQLMRVQLLCAKSEKSACWAAAFGRVATRHTATSL